MREGHRVKRRVVANEPAGLDMLEVESFQEAEKLSLLHFVLPEYHDAFVALNQRVIGGESGTLEFQIEGMNGTRAGSVRMRGPYAMPRVK